MKLLERKEGAAVGLLGKLFVIVYEATPTLLTAKFIAAQAKRVFVTPSVRVHVLVVIDSKLPMPDTATRQEIAAMMKQFEHGVEGLAQLVLGSGFSGATLRAALAGTNLLARARYPNKVFDDVPKTMAWLSSQGAFPAHEVDTMTAEVRQFAGIAGTTVAAT